ncbi:hypothetical protein ACFCX4_24195 [Kitasatospora sp. NPDC056327]|uniref:hypothetical protein n=1 Tax=Kitasatospora sp. NPDC056327 TaxID=3345785 RepID=UPI0035D6C0FA
MYRTVRTFAVLLAAVGAVSLPATQAFAEDTSVNVTTTTITVIGTGNQLAGDDITNVGGDAIIGSFDGIDVH